MVAPTSAPTPALTSTPALAPTFGPTSNWNQLKNECESSGCDTANGGCTITLSEDFVMGSYSGEIEFSGKAITIWGQGKVLDASGAGRFFNGGGADSFLELRDALLQNGNAAYAGAIYVVSGAIVEIYTSQFINNQASDRVCQ
jgi:hypothetical protein